MSTQSILHKEIGLLSDKVDQTLIKFADKFILNSRFGVGKTYNQNDFREILWLDKLLCNENCRLVNFDDTLQEKLNLILLKYS